MTARESPAQKSFGEWRRDVPRDGSRDVASAAALRNCLVGKEASRALAEVQMHGLCSEPLGKGFDLQLHDAFNFPFAERAKQHDVIDAIEQFGSQRRFEFGDVEIR